MVKQGVTIAVDLSNGELHLNDTLAATITIIRHNTSRLFMRIPPVQKTIAEKLLVSKSNVVAVIDKLEKSGLVLRERCREDRRQIYVNLTEEGRNKIEAVLPGHVATIVEAFSVLDEEEQILFGKICKKLGLRNI